MKQILIIMMLFVLIPTSVFGGTIINFAGKSGNIIIWKSAEAQKACYGEIEEMGKPGAICHTSYAASVPPGTKAVKLSGWIFIKVQILEGPYVGAIGYIATEYYEP